MKIENKKFVKNLKKRSNFEQYAKSTIKTFLLMNKNHFRSSSFWLGNILIPMIVILTAGSLFPVFYSYIWMVFISLTFAGLSGYGTLLYVIRKSTIKKNFDMTATESSALYSGMLMTMFEIMFITMFIVILSLFIFDELGLLSHQWSFDIKDVTLGSKIIWGKIDWIMVITYTNTSTIIIFALAFFFEQTLKTQKNFFIASFIYIIYGMFFSGIMTSTIFIKPDGNAGVLSVNDWDHLGEGEFINIDTNGIIRSYLIGGIPWFLGIIMPHYGLNQLAINTINQGMELADGTIMNPHLWLQVNNGVEPSTFSEVSATTTFLTHASDGIVMAYWIIPLVQVWLLFLVGGMLARYKDK